MHRVAFYCLCSPARLQRRFWLAGALLLLGACASAPQVSDKTTSQFNDRAPVATALTTLAASRPQTGVRLLADPTDALQSRLHLAALASSTLDIQYYLWQGDDSGLGLTQEILAAGDQIGRAHV